MAKLTLQVRTEDNLLEILMKGESCCWVVAEDKIQMITNVHVVNFDGKQMIQGIFDPDSPVVDNGRLAVRFFDACIVNCEIEFESRNPVSYL